jgi:hypothetical protein
MSISTVWGRADAPKPPFHPHCYCLLSPVINLINPKPKFNPKAERKFLNALPANEARQVAGSMEKRDRILAGKATMEEVYNEGKDELYRWKRAGDFGQTAPTTATKTGVDVSNAYEEAKEANGKYHGWLKQQRNLPVHLLEKAIRSFEKRIAEHQLWIEDPARKNPDFYQLPIGQQKHLLEKHWPDDLQRHRDSIEILKGVTQEKQDDRQ